MSTSSEPDLTALATGLARSLVEGRCGPGVVAIPFAGQGPVLFTPLDGRHPLELLLGEVAPATWEAVAIVACGTVVAAGGPGPGSPRIGSRVAAASAAARRGPEVSVVVDGRGRRLAAATGGEGLVPDAARRFLGRGTPPPQDPVTAWWAVEWLRDVVQLLAERPRPCGLADLVAAHPGVAGDELPHTASSLVRFLVDRGWDHARRTGWEGVRTSLAEGLLDDPSIPPQLAAWFDAGSFSRYALAVRPRPGDLLDVLVPRLDPQVAGALSQILTSWAVTS